MAHEVEQLAKTVKGKHAIAIDAFARALRQLPTIIADNGGINNFKFLIIF